MGQQGGVHGHQRNVRGSRLSGDHGVSHETADQLDEALGLGLGWTGTAELGKCEKCKKWDALFLDAASLTATSGASEIWDPSRLSQDPAAAQDPGRFGV